ncbi:uncharacterized protein si:zfos-911d5.4 isoform X1 [Tachysurus ichikawai]
MMMSRWLLNESTPNRSSRSAGQQQLGLQRSNVTDVQRELDRYDKVTVRMYKRGPRSWLGKPLSGTTTIPSNTHIVFRISGDDKDAKIPANNIHTITLSI